MSAPSPRSARFPNEYGQTPELREEVLDWPEVAARIAASPNYFVATTTDDGRPYLRPVDGVFVDDALCFGGSPETRWVRHLQQRPEVSASLPDDNHAVILEGAVELVTDESLPVSVALGPANREKYPQYYSGDDAPPFRPFWCLRPRTVYAWSLAEFPAKATRFSFD